MLLVLIGVNVMKAPFWTPLADTVLTIDVGPVGQK